MHLLGCARDRIHRAGLQAQGAADTTLFVDESDGLGFFHAVFGIQRLELTAQQVGELADTLFAARGQRLISASPLAMAVA